MKKLLLNLSCCLLFTISFSQERLITREAVNLSASKIPCTPGQTLSFNTGLDINGNLISPSVADPFWGGVAIPNLTGVYAPWNVISGTAILSPNNQQIGKSTFRRYFYLCKESQISFKGVYRDDNVVNSFELKNASASVVWAHTPLPVNNPQCYKDNPFSGTVGLPAGAYYFEFTYTNYGSYGGFALSGTLTANAAVLSNFKDCCCDCSRLPKQPAITGPTCFCLGKACDNVFTYSVPDYGSSNCFTYSWKVTGAAGQNIAITGQGTNQISFNCKGLKPGTYNITVQIKCGDNVVTNTVQLVVCAAPDPAFTMSSNSNDVTLASSVAGTHFWFLVKDNDNNCAYSAGDTYSFLGGNTALFTGLANNQQYTVYHFVFNQCGNDCFCWSSKIMCFKWLPSQLMKTANGAKGVESVSEKEIERLEEIPAIFKKELPKEIFKAERKETETSVRKEL